MIKAAIKCGLDGIAITDHGTVRGSLAALDVARALKLDFIVITGSEVRTAGGHLLALGITEDVPERLSVEETVERVHALGGITIAAHPFASYLIGKCLKQRALVADAIEVLNALHMRRCNRAALLFALANGRPQTAGSDAHMAKAVGVAGVVIDSDPLTEIKKGRARTFGSSVPLRDVASLTVKKFCRSIRRRIC
jgi:hypothetical protein